jgi:hypothetical protein
MFCGKVAWEVWRGRRDVGKRCCWISVGNVLGFGRLFLKLKIVMEFRHLHLV